MKKISVDTGCCIPPSGLQQRRGRGTLRSLAAWRRQGGDDRTGQGYPGDDSDRAGEEPDRDDRPADGKDRLGVEGLRQRAFGSGTGVVQSARRGQTGLQPYVRARHGFGRRRGADPHCRTRRRCSTPSRAETPTRPRCCPTGNIVVASSTGNLLSVYVYNGADSYVSRPAFTMPVHSAHNVVWDRKRGCLWTATGAQLLKLTYNGNRTAPELTQVRSYDMAAGEYRCSRPGARLRRGCDVCIDESACLQVRLCGGEVPRRGDLPAEHHQEHFDGPRGLSHDRHAPHVGREQLVVGRGVAT